MPRKARIDASGAFRLLIIRGIERLNNILTDTSTPCYAWIQMTNHVHLLLRTGHAPLSTVTRRLLTGYDRHMTIQEFVTDSIIES